MIAGEQMTCVEYAFGYMSSYCNKYCDGDVFESNEGVTWCRGWYGRVADSFRVACALVSTDEDVLDT